MALHFQHKTRRSNLAKKNFDTLTEYGTSFQIKTVTTLLKNRKFLEQINDIGADVISLDWKQNIPDSLRVLGKGQVIQGNLDPAVLLYPREILKQRIIDI